MEKAFRRMGPFGQEGNGRRERASTDAVELQHTDAEFDRLLADGQVLDVFALFYAPFGESKEAATEIN